MIEHAKPVRRWRLRKWPVVMAAVLILGTLAWHAVEYALNVDQYRDRATETITHRTGLPARIAELDLSLFPLPALYAYDVAVGEGDFIIQCGSISVRPSLRGLLSKTIVADNVHVSGLHVTIPPESSELQSRLDAVRAKLAEPQPKSGFKVSVSEVTTTRARITVAGSDTPLVTFGLTAGDVLGAATPLSIDAAAPFAGQDARLAADIVLATNDSGGKSLNGEVRLTHASPAAVSPSPDADMLRIDATANVRSTSLDSIELDITGETRPHADGPASLGGTITAKAWIQDGALIVNDMVWDAEDFDLRADLQRHVDGVVACKIIEARLKESGIAQLASMAATDDFRVRPQHGSLVEAANLLIGVEPGASPRLAQGSIRFHGLDVVTRDGSVVESNLRGEILLEEGKARLAELKGDSTSFSGTIQPDVAAKSVAIDLAGTASLSKEKLAVFTTVDPITELKGDISIDRLAGTFGGGVPADLVVQGRLNKGFVKLKTDAIEDVLSPVTATFTTTTEGIETEAEADASKLGPMSLKGNYRFATRTWNGDVTLDVARAVPPFLNSETTRERLAPILGTYGKSIITIDAKLPAPDSATATIHIVRRGEPAMKGTVSLVNRGGVWKPGDIVASGDIDVAAVQALVGDDIALSGVAPVRFERSLKSESLALDADLTPVRARIGTYIEKAPGMPASGRITGPASDTLWTADAFTFTILGETIQGTLKNDRVRVPSLELDLAALSPLIAQGGTLRGAVSGAFSSNPTETSLQLAKVGFAFPGGPAIDAIDGRIEYGAGALVLDNLTMTGANSDCTFNIRNQGGAWKGQLQGSKIDANAMLALAGAVSAFSRSADSDAAAASPSNAKPMKAELNVAANSLYYKRAAFSGVRADIAVDGREVRVRGINLVPYSGTITGQANVTLAHGGEPLFVDTSLKLNNIDARIIDDVAPIEPRGYRGTLTGTIDFRAPIPDTGSPLHRASGAMLIQGTNGSLGKMGMATRLLSALRTVELLRLRMPPMEDGLTYDTMEARVAMNNGQMDVQTFNLSNPSMLIDANGSIDWPSDYATMAITVYPLEAITGIVDVVPVVGSAAKGVRNQFGLKFNVTGPITAPDVRLAPGQQLDRLKVDVKSSKEIVESVKEKTVDKAVETIGNAIGGILGK